MFRPQTLNNHRFRSLQRPSKSPSALYVYLLGWICITQQRPHRAAASVNVRCSPLCVSPLWDEGVEQRGQQ